MCGIAGIVAPREAGSADLRAAVTEWYQRNNRTNLFGHYSEVEDYRQLAEADFVVGIFGGSVAADLALADTRHIV